MTPNENSTIGDEFDPSIARQFETIQAVPAPDVWRRVVDEHGRTAIGSGRRTVVVLVAAAALAVVATGLVALAYRRDGTAPDAIQEPDSTVAARGSTSGAATASTSPPRVGTAVPLPAIVEPGRELTVTPSGQIVPNCLEIAMVSTLTASGQEPLGLVWPDGKWWQLPEGTSPTWLACGTYPSTDAITYRIPGDLADGHYVISLTEPATEEACATFEVATTPPSASAARSRRTR